MRVGKRLNIPPTDINRCSSLAHTANLPGKSHPRTCLTVLPLEFCFYDRPRQGEIKIKIKIEKLRSARDTQSASTIAILTRSIVEPANAGERLLDEPQSNYSTAESAMIQE
ncbi:hypothetical protein O181_076665 [Austropuccinia psidii MF-1]|uniref:Uncharacterized protein n=1 Tax=Austropuccinia psidii MF-1 TaxID=1389203 RepID=A0A9Q3IF85_9BASI|nr:hypothetical protein [Austropuccinia psidii MF-1]